MNWNLDISQAQGPLYLAVASEIVRAIESGELPPGARLPPQRDLAEQLGVTVGTVNRAYALARERQLIVGEVGRGTYVQGVPRSERAGRFIPAQADTGVDLSSFTAAMEEVNPRFVRAVGSLGERLATLPLHKYSKRGGETSHRAAGAAWLKRCGVQARVEEVFISNGAQEAIAVCLGTFTRAGEVVLAEELTYSGIKSIAAMHGVRLHPVQMDAQGMVPEALEQAVAETGARVVYVQPTIQNPTTISMPEKRRKRIAQVAQKLGLLLIEDDAASSALTRRPPSLTSLAPERSCYITSLSKSVSPALRIAYIHAGPEMGAAISDALYTFTLGASSIAAEIATSIIESGVASDCADAYVSSMERCLKIARESFPQGSMAGTPGACFFWLALPDHWAAEDFVRAAGARNISLPAPDSFQVAGATSRNGIRVSLNASIQPEALRRAFGVMRDSIESRPRLRQAVI